MSEQTRYTVTNIQSRARLCNEMTKILFCKFYDEKLDSDVPYFQVLPDKSPPEIKRNIEEKLWKPVLRDLDRTGIFQKNEGIILDPDSIVYVAGELERLNLSETDCDVIGAAFEVFAERYFVGEKGEFFTPRIAIKNAIKMLNPQYSNVIIDPACGSGGFLIYALEHIWEKIESSSLNKEEARRIAPSFIYGIDKEPDLVKVARAYMTLIGDGSTSIVDADSLKPFDNWDDRARSLLIAANSNKMKTFDFVFTNPPFGADIKIKHRNILQKYDLGHKWEKLENPSRWIKSEETKPTDPQILFLELCVNLLNEGGKMCIVLPESVLGNVKEEYVRQWLFDNTTILAVWDCPALLFQPHTNTKTCMLFVEKSKTTNQSIMMSAISKCGHNSRGSEVRNEDNELVEDFSKALDDWQNRPSENYSNLRDWKGKVSIVVSSSDVVDKRILVPRIYQLVHELGPITKPLGELEQQKIISIKTVPCSVKQSEYDNLGEIPFVRTTDLGVMELRPTIQRVPLGVYEREQVKQDVCPFDILIIKDGTYRIGEPIMLLEDDIKIVLQGHFYKIRVLDDSKLDPYFLFYALKKSQSFIVASSLVQVTLSSITIDRMREIPIPFPSDDEQTLISKKMREILEQRRHDLKRFKQL